MEVNRHVFKMFFLFILLFCVGLVNSQDEGEKCLLVSGSDGICKNIRNCPKAIEDIKNRKIPQTCGFSGLDTIVCCPTESPATPATDKPVTATTTSTRPLATTTRRVKTTTEYTPTEPDYVDNNGGTSKDGCEALSPSLTSKKTGRKAWDKCIEYQEKFVYPCEPGVALIRDVTRVNHCMHNADELIVGGVDAATGEFPHMALLGYGNYLLSASWLCGGAILSENYILTAGHCLFHRDLGPVTYTMIGILKRTDDIDSSKVYKVKKSVKYPEYYPPGKYNDIALLETERPMKLGPYAVPACLDVGDVNGDRVLATGWGRTTYGGDLSDTLQKVTLTKFTNEECSDHFPPERKMKQGLNESTQICYGDKTMSKDTCQGDSGCPIQIKNSKIHCMYTIVGVTSFGRACGYVGQPGVYTRVEYYTPWIESVLWPDQ